MFGLRACLGGLGLQHCFQVQETYVATRIIMNLSPQENM